MTTVYVVYHSQEAGNTAKLAEHVAAGCREAGAEVTCVNTNDARASVDAAEAADAYAIGTPDYFSYPAGGIKQFFDDIYTANFQKRNVFTKPVALFCTHGGGGKATGPLGELAQSCKLCAVDDVLSCKLAPDDAAAEKARTLGKALVSAAEG